MLTELKFLLSLAYLTEEHGILLSIESVFSGIKEFNCLIQV
jgi:hypothetical protein